MLTWAVARMIVRLNGRVGSPDFLIMISIFADILIMLIVALITMATISKLGG